MKEVKFRKCAKCGAVVEVLENDNNSTFICCGEPMEEMVPNSVDASFERHVPDIHIEDETMIIQVNHVMEENHYIKWIMVVTEKEERKYFFKPGDVPEVFLPYEKATVYAYCNLHGVWKKEVE